MADSRSERDRWKFKYLESLEEFDKKEKKWREADQLLRHGLSRMALVSHGVDGTLDSHLKKLRKALQNGANVDIISEIIEKTSLYMKTLDEQREAGKRLPDPATILLQVVDAIPFPSSVLAAAGSLKVRLARADAADHLTALIDEFAQLVSRAFYGEKVDSGNTPVAQAEATAERPGWLQRLFGGGGRKEVGQPSEPESRQHPSAEGLSGLFDIDRREQITSASDGERTPAVGMGCVDESVEDVFLEILESLGFPPHLSERVQLLKEQLTAGLDPNSIKGMTESVVALVVDMRSALEEEKAELEVFLQQLTQRLTELEAMVEGVESHRIASLVGGRKLDAVVNAEVSDIENTVKTSTDIGQMKCAIQISLDKIREHLAEQRDHEELHQDHLDEELKELTQQLQQMERESEQLKERLAKERLEALTDPLTGAPNRLAYEQRVMQEFSRWQRYKNPFTMVICDVDHFKKINDTYGHKAGDRALIAIVKTIEFHLRETDFLARVGGEEFVILLTETTQEGAKSVAEKLRKSVQLSEFVYQGQPVPVTISGGFSEFQQGDTVDTVYQRADEALYRAKKSGRNRFFPAPQTIQ